MSNYLNQLNEMMVPSPNHRFRALDLFAGCVRLSLGFKANEILTDGIEVNADAVATYCANLSVKCNQRTLGPTDHYESDSYDIVIGGPPCQPFSVRGLQKGIDDSRGGFPIFINAVKQIRPKIWMFENVRGLMHHNRWCLDEILTRLSSLGYQITYPLVNASRYGVPQNRERLIAIGHKGCFRFPRPYTITYAAGDAIADICYTIADGSKVLTPSMDEYIKRYEKSISIYKSYRPTP